MIGVWGRDYDLHIACVTRVKPDSEYPRTFDNSDTIPEDSKVKRLQRFDGKPIDPGGNRWRPISSFQLIEDGTGGASDGIMAQAAQFTATFNASRESLLRSTRVTFGFAPRDVIPVLTGGTAGDARGPAPSAMGAGVPHAAAASGAPSSAPATRTGVPPPVVYVGSQPEAAAPPGDVSSPPRTAWMDQKAENLVQNTGEMLHRKDLATASGTTDGATNAGMITKCQVQFCPGLLENINSCANCGRDAHHACVNKRVMPRFNLDHFVSGICYTKK